MALFFLSNILFKLKLYILLFFCPVNRQILNAEPFPKIGDSFRDSIDDMCNFIADDELNILDRKGDTLAASSSPMKRPSLILMGPRTNS